jgi:hypothetical protein
VTHLDNKIDCYDCNRRFKTYAGMILHLESGACYSHLEILDLNKTAAQCHKWYEFITNSDYRDYMLDMVDLCEEYNRPLPYECPGCESNFSRLSALFMHVDSGYCQQTLHEGSIEHLIESLSSRHGRD